MQLLSGIVQSTKAIKWSNGEVFYNLVDFGHYLERQAEDTISAEECLIIPYYIHAGQRYELYEYELSISLADEQDFCQYLLKKTGKKSIQEVSESVIHLQKECHIEVLKSDGRLPLKRVQQYIEFLCAEEDMIFQIQKIFGTFQCDNLWFSFY